MNEYRRVAVWHPIHLVLLGLAAVYAFMDLWSEGNATYGVFVLIAEVAWRSLAPALPAWRRMVDRAAEGRALAERGQYLKGLRDAMGERDAATFDRLQGRLEEVRDLAARNDEASGPLIQDLAREIAELVEGFAKLAAEVAALSVSPSGPSEGELESQATACEESAAGCAAQDPLRDHLAGRARILRARAEGHRERAQRIPLVEARARTLADAADLVADRALDPASCGASPVNVTALLRGLKSHRAGVRAVLDTEDGSSDEAAAARAASRVSAGRGA